MNEKLTEQFRELYRVLIDAEHKIKSMPVGQLNSEQRKFLDNANVLVVVAQGAISQIFNVKEDL